ncbi:hypothetical protein [Natrarchaeobaculum aegyptiacum]|uniref:PGF-pre-PGF domain-containing protein n=1 Tax=Natrarchaeobaculum aegyptiacum TaxID=745377 RepID=A0A2Z2HSE3_9EURY|nr:hypothetical protein [Natrarchaeobaculum aegyptiacum]ARS90141.1 hypothetical protein B1756_10640 [Natrarchaeobaculum aegyptiacum]
MVALLVLASVAGVASVGVDGVTAQSTHDAGGDSSDTYVVEQAGTCHEIQPLETGGTVEGFYDYRNHETHPDIDDNEYSSYGTTHLQRDDTSILMLHEGTDGTSLVAVHDRLGGATEGGVVSFNVVGVPPEADWVVRDDEYRGETNMAEWHAGHGWLAADWIWADGRTDGGAIRGGLEDDLALTIHPAFNEASPFYDDPTLHDPDWHGDGRIAEWHLLSGDANQPERIPLALDQPVTIRSGTCDEPAVRYYRTTQGVGASVDGASGADGDALETLEGASDDVRFEGVEFAGVDSAESVRVSDGAAGDREGPADAVVLSAIDVREDGNAASGTVRASVSTAWLESADLAAANVTIYAGAGGEWTELDVAHHADGDRYVLEASGLTAPLEHVVVAVPDDVLEESETWPADDDSSSEGERDDTGEDDEGGTESVEDADSSVDTDVGSDVLELSPAPWLVVLVLGSGLTLLSAAYWMRSGQ